MNESEIAPFQLRIHLELTVIIAQAQKGFWYRCVSCVHVLLEVLLHLLHLLPPLHLSLLLVFRLRLIRQVFQIKLLQTASQTRLVCVHALMEIRLLYQEVTGITAPFRFKAAITEY